MNDLLKRISLGEGQNVDFKFRIDDQSKIARTLAAFANSDGGSLLIGVKDNGKISGCDPEEEFYMVQGAAELACRPSVQFESMVWQERHYYVLEISVNRSDSLIKSKDEDGKWIPFYRVKDRTVRGNKVLNKLWYLRKNKIVKPEKFTDEEINVIKVILEYGPISLSKLNRMTQIGFDELSNLLATLILWNIVGIDANDDGVQYYCAEFQD